MKPRTKHRFVFWIETVIASIAAFLGSLTLLYRDWIERLFGIDLDHHSGAAEWQLALGLLLVAITSASLAHREWNRAALIPASKT